MDSAPPRKQIGKYDVIEVLGRGGMGVVYKAMDSRIKRLVAIKMMTGEVAKDPDYLKRFYREAQSTGILQHPNIVVVYDLGDEEGNPYLVMEFLEGITVDKVIATRTELSIYEKLNIIIQVLEGLSYAHQRGIVHRDIKPQNIMVLRDRTVKIVDFGIARMGNTGLTKTGQVIGTISYMSPEQINAAAVDGRSDIFSAAVVLYELLTYSLPFEGATTTATIMKILQEPAPPLKERLGASYPPQLDNILARALAKDREERYPTAAQFAVDLVHVRDQLKRDLVVDYLDRGRAAMQRGELGSARELLQQVVKIDSQHALGKELLQQVHDRMYEQQRREQLRQLKADAEDAFSRQLYDDALQLVEQALGLDKGNAELQKLRNAVQEAKFKKERLDASLRRAQTAQQAGDLEQAQRAVEEALAIDPSSSQAKLLKTQVMKRIDEQTRARQLAELVENARLNIQSRRYTVASDLLQQARIIAPDSIEVQVLMREAEKAHEEETRRRQLEMLTRQIEEALTVEDVDTAWNKCNEALVLAPGDAHILELRRQAEEQRGEAQKKKQAEQAVEEAGKLVAAGRLLDALRVLEAALQRFPADTRLNSLLATVRQAVEKENQEKLKREFLAKAKTALDQRNYAAAIETLKSAQIALEGDREIEQLLKFAQDEIARQDQGEKVEALKRQAQQYVAEGEFDRAIAMLEGTAADVPELQPVLSETRRAADEFRREMGKVLGKAQQLSMAGKAEDAVVFLEANARLYGRRKEFQEILAEAKAARAATAPKPAPAVPEHGEAARAAAPGSATQMMMSPTVAPPPPPVIPPAAPPVVAPQPPPAAATAAAAPKPAPVRPAPATAPGKGTKAPLVIVAVVVLLAVLGGVGYLVKTKFMAPKTATTGDTAFIQVNAVPWGTVKSITAKDGSLTRAIDQPTPLRIALPPGEYDVIVSGPGGEEQKQSVKVTNDAPAQCQPVFGSVDIDAIVNSSK
ncbi:MAG: protein kinase [Terriglobales bacterium]